jgi:hypothetical protein
VTENANRGETYALALLDAPFLRDVDLAVTMRPVGGTEDPGGGLVWRVRDENHYYLARWNPREENLRLYVVQDGVRRALVTKSVKVPDHTWHRLRVQARGPRIEVFFDEDRLVLVEDRTFSTAGRIGVWVKADALTQFDELALAPL